MWLWPRNEMYCAKWLIIDVSVLIHNEYLKKVDFIFSSLLVSFSNGNPRQIREGSTSIPKIWFPNLYRIEPRILHVWISTAYTAQTGFGAVTPGAYTLNFFDDARYANKCNPAWKAQSSCPARKLQQWFKVSFMDEPKLAISAVVHPYFATVKPGGMRPGKPACHGLFCFTGEYHAFFIYGEFKISGFVCSFQ